MANLRLTPTSYVVLGLVEARQPVTPYELKRFGEVSVFNFWSVPHTQVYAECQRLTEAGLLLEEREEGGRRRRRFRLAKAGQRALDSWRGSPEARVFEYRDEAMLKLFFGGDRRAIAAAQIDGHARRLELFEGLQQAKPGMPRGMRDALEAGLALERDYVAFWERLRRA
jgi:DNA-binding PadR family transcriptional regulator